MPLKIVHGDITTMDVDAIVNAANNSLLGGGGVDGAIHRAAGPRLLEETRTLNGCDTGDAKISGGYNLKARHVIHTVGPIWMGGKRGEEMLLRSAYRRSLEVAEENHLETVAFSLISSGVYGYPKDKALKVAVSEINHFLEDHEMMVYLVIYDRKRFAFSPELRRDIQDYLDENLADSDFGQSEETDRPPIFDQQSAPRQIQERDALSMQRLESTLTREKARNQSLEDFLSDQAQTFSQRLFQLIDSKGISDVQAYKQANVDRKLFSKIRSNPNYQPSKATVLAFAISLQLSMRETEKLLKTAGYALSSASRSDLIIEYFIRNGRYDIHEINEALFYFEENLLGA